MYKVNDENIADSLLKGESVYLFGVGTLVPYVRKVKNDKGRDFSVKIKIEQDSCFHDEMVSAYESDNNLFKRSNEL